MGANSNYPAGIDGSHPYFNWQDPPECPHCTWTLEEDWTFCPNCGERIDWDEVARCS